MTRSASIAAASAAAIVLFAGCGQGGGQGSQTQAQAATASSSAAAQQQGAALGGHYVQRNLVSDGFIPAEHEDDNLVNSWGIAHLATSPWWVADNGTGVATLYDGEGVARPLVVTVTGAGGERAAPTGLVANADPAFVVTSGTASGPARFIFASEDGTISGWNPNVPPSSTTTIVAVETPGAIYKGLALASTAAGDRLYATDFHNAHVDVFDATFKPVTIAGAFVDPGIPDGFAPFGIQAVNGMILVTYAMQDEAKEDDVAGKHLGFVSAFTTEGAFLRRVVTRGKLDAPWGMALASEKGFGRFSGKLLVGNFGDGHIIGYDLERGDQGENGQDEAGGGAYLTGVGGPIVIDGLWGIGFGNDFAAGPSTTLFFAAGPDDEAHGLFGRIDFVHGKGD